MLKKGWAGEFSLALDELDECISSGNCVEQQVDYTEIGECISRFLRDQPKVQRQVFICRYWYIESIRNIATRFRMSESKVKSMLFCTRNKLRLYLKSEGIVL